MRRGLYTKGDFVMKKRTLTRLWAFAVSLGVLAGCASGSGSSGSSAAGGSQTAPGSSSPSGSESVGGSGEEKIYYDSSTTAAANVNPHEATSTYDSEITRYTVAASYRYVATEDRQSAVVVPNLAADVPKQIDDYTWQITLDDRACWQDGVPITAEDMVQSMKYGLDPIMMHAPCANLAQGTINIKNAQDYYTQGDSNSVAWEDVGLKVIDDKTFEVVTEQRYTQNEVMRFFSGRVTAPVRLDMYESMMNETKTSTLYGTEADKFISNGPFILTGWTKGNERTFEKNPNYLHADDINLDKIVVKIVNDNGTLLQMFESGQLDRLELTTEGYKKYEEDPRVVSYSNRVVRQIEINRSSTEKPILGSKKFRQALFYAIDRETLAKMTDHSPAPYYVSTFSVAYDTGKKFRDLPETQAYTPANNGYDAEKAKQLFDEACAEVGQTGKLELTLNYYDSRDDVKMMSEYLQKSLPEIFGADKFELKLQALPSASLFETMRNCHNDDNAYELSWASWSWGSGDEEPGRIFEPYQSTYSRRLSNYGNEKLDTLYQALRSEEVRLDTAKCIEMAQEMEQLAIDEVFVVPVFQVVNKIIFSDRVITPVDTEVPGLEWGLAYFDLDLGA